MPKMVPGSGGAAVPRHSCIRAAMVSWAEALAKIARMILTIKLDWNWSSFQLANSAPPLGVTDSAIAPSARMPAQRCLAPRNLPADCKKRLVEPAILNIPMFSFCLRCTTCHAPASSITAFTSQRTNLSPFTKGCREWDASM